jgi:hypothetical protein
MEKEKKDIQHFNILILTPGRNMEAEYVKSLIETIGFLNKSNISYLFLNQYNSMVTTAREATIMGSNNLNIYTNKPLNGEVTYDKIMWIDSDISWTIEDFMKLYSSKDEIISGLYFNESMTPMCSKNGEGVNLADYIKTGEKVEIDGVGFGFLCVKSGVFENVKRPWFETKLIPIDEKNPSFVVPLGEDFSWCLKAKDAGYKILLDTSVLLSHHKKVSVRLSENELQSIRGKNESDTTF